MPNDKNPWVGILMGSKNDWDVMSAAKEALDELGIPYEARVLSAHRTPDETLKYAETAEARGLEVIIAGAGSAAHLAGVIAAKTLLPVLGVPIASSALQGMDALLSIVQMPKGIPVGTLAIGKAGAANAGLLAAAIIGAKRPEIREKLRAMRSARREQLLNETLE